MYLQKVWFSKKYYYFHKMFFEQDITMRYTVDDLGLYPSVIVNEDEIGIIVDRLKKTLETVE